LIKDWVILSILCGIKWILCFFGDKFQVACQLKSFVTALGMLTFWKIPQTLSFQLFRIIYFRIQTANVNRFESKWRTRLWSKENEKSFQGQLPFLNQKEVDVENRKNIFCWQNRENIFSFFIRENISGKWFSLSNEEQSIF